jgi:hypothetical protein
MKLVTASKSRYNGGVRAKRLYGSACITTFYVFRPEDKDNPNRWVTIEVGGKTPGERSTKAKELAEPKIRELLAKEGIVYESSS